LPRFKLAIAVALASPALFVASTTSSATADEIAPVIMDGTVLDDFGQPVPDVELVASAEYDTTHGTQENLISTATTDSQGRVTRSTTSRWNGWFQIGTVELSSTQERTTGIKLTYNLQAGRNHGYLCGNDDDPIYASFSEEVPDP